MARVVSASEGEAVVSAGGTVSAGVSRAASVAAPAESPATATAAATPTAERADMAGDAKGEGDGKTRAGRPGRAKKRLKDIGIIFIAIVVFSTTAYIGFDTWLTNNRMKAEIAGQRHDAQGQVNGQADHSKEMEGTDEQEVSPASLSEYVVAANMPRYLLIDKLHIKARIRNMGLNKDGSVQAPINIYDAGWYNDSAKPGGVGASFIDGHASGALREGLFAYLETLAAGDIIGVEMGDGTVFRYKVQAREIVPLKDVDMKKVLLPYGNATRGLNLMTCTGTWVQSGSTYDHRIIVYSELID